MELRSIRREFRLENLKSCGKYPATVAAVCAFGSLVSVFAGSENGWYRSLVKFPLALPQYALMLVGTLTLAIAGAAVGTIIPRCEKRYLPYKGRGLLLFCASVAFLWLFYPLTFTAKSLYCGLCCALIAAVFSLYSALYLSKLRFVASAGAILLFVWSIYLSYLSFGLFISNIK